MHLHRHSRLMQKLIQTLKHSFTKEHPQWMSLANNKKILEVWACNHTQVDSYGTCTFSISPEMYCTWNETSKKVDLLKFLSAHIERVSKETNPHTTSKSKSTDIQGLLLKVHPKLKSNLSA
jgi:hypothetical protein